ncbi:hypothetical protein LRO89_07990 [Priestia megaterium]|uniref:hypothetical protein n=1 Tax=Priestia megaterium TaxID=1404 RepID=UPI0039C32133
MKKSLIYLFSIVVIILMVSGCSYKKEYANEYPKELLSDGNGYSVLAVGKEIKNPENIDGIKKVRYYKSTKEAKEEYPKLEIKNAPYFMVFNKEKVVYKTDEYNKMINFVKK